MSFRHVIDNDQVIEITKHAIGIVESYIGHPFACLPPIRETFNTTTRCIELFGLDAFAQPFVQNHEALGFQDSFAQFLVIQRMDRTALSRRWRGWRLGLGITGYIGNRADIHVVRRSSKQGHGLGVRLEVFRQVFGHAHFIDGLIANKTSHVCRNRSDACLGLVPFHLGHLNRLSARITYAGSEFTLDCFMLGHLVASYNGLAPLALNRFKRTRFEMTNGIPIFALVVTQ